MLILLWVIAITTGALCILYTILIARYCYGWISTEEAVKEAAPQVTVAVIIAARNEEKTLARCLDALAAQVYPAGAYEIIIADDHSEDGTAAVIGSYAVRHANIRSVRLSDPLISGKKQAIAAAIAATGAELIITTDADCTMDRHWLATLAAFYEKTGSKMIVGPVSFEAPGSLFEKLQDVELMALMGSTAGSLYDHHATLCNGANLAYPRDVFYGVGGFAGIDQKASGDDVLLMYRIAAKYGSGVRFLKSREAIVYTPAKKRLRDFISQRKRWASKGLDALNGSAKRVSLLVYGFSFLLLLMGLISGFAALKSAVCLPFLWVCLIMMGIKCIIDFLLLFLAASFFRRQHELFYFLPLQLIYILYVTAVGALGSIGKYEWKGRKF